MRIICHILAINLFFLNFCLQASEAVEKVVIIGAGAAGSSAAIFAGQANLNPLVIQDSNCGAQMALIHKIDNYPGILEEVEGIDLLNRFREQAQKFGARFHKGSVVEVDLSNRPFRIDLKSGETVYAETIIIASGTQKRWLELPNEEALKDKGVIAASFCRDPNFFNEKRVVVVGGGHAALQEAHYISETADLVTLVNRSSLFNASKFHQEQVFNNEKIDVLYDTEVDDILDPYQDRVTEVILKNRKTGAFTSVPADLVLVAIGNRPNTDLFQGQLELSPSGQIVINGKDTSTSIEGVFSAGDISDVSYGRVVISAGAGAMAALDTIRYLNTM